MANVNEGHRQRLRQRMMKEGLQNFQDHEVLELLLFQSLPRRDTNKLAHDLINKFGGLSKVLDATPEQLMTVEGISQITACNIAVLKEIWSRYKKSAANPGKLSGLSSLIKYAQTIISESYVEKMVVVYVDNFTRFITSDDFCSQDTQYVSVDIKKVVASVVRSNAAGVVLFHCHVNGPCEPSNGDKTFTEKLFFTLANMNIPILDHLIFNSHGDYYSFHQRGELEIMAQKYRQNITAAKADK